MHILRRRPLSLPSQMDLLPSRAQRRSVLQKKIMGIIDHADSPPVLECIGRAARRSVLLLSPIKVIRNVVFEDGFEEGALHARFDARHVLLCRFEQLEGVGRVSLFEQLRGEIVQNQNEMYEGILGFLVLPFKNAPPDGQGILEIFETLFPLPLILFCVDFCLVLALRLTIMMVILQLFEFKQGGGEGEKKTKIVMRLFFLLAYLASSFPCQSILLLD